MNIFQVLESDHRQMRRLMQELQATSARAKKKRAATFSRLKRHYLGHMQAEERIFYPFMMDASEDQNPIFETMEEHQASRSILRDLEAMPTDHERWGAKLQVLQEMLAHHLTEEEARIFVPARLVMDKASARAMAEAFETMKERSISDHGTARGQKKDRSPKKRVRSAKDRDAAHGQIH